MFFDSLYVGTHGRASLRAKTIKINNLIPINFKPK